MLKEKQVCFTGTVRENRLPNCPIKSGKQLLKGNRGDFDCAVDTNSSVLVVRWNDNSAVTVATNNGVVHPLVSVKRYNRKMKKELSVPQPNVIHEYNRNMGGVDLLDNGVANYRIKLHNMVNDSYVSQVDFRSYIVSVLLRGDMGTTSLSQEEDGE
ncbi:Transposase IS4 [Popillia japonica]|uniref:Transposase IS4 n=1 Tax=Popillia japonica TaxID=7064 RepID=A0AAW1LT03_POPJA